MRGNLATYLGGAVLLMPPLALAGRVVQGAQPPDTVMLVIGGLFLALALIVARGSMLGAAFAIVCWLGYAALVGPSHVSEGPAWYWPGAGVGALFLVFAMLGAHQIEDDAYWQQKRDG